MINTKHQLKHGVPTSHPHKTRQKSLNIIARCEVSLYLTLLCLATMPGQLSLYRIKNPVDLLRLRLSEPTASVRQEGQTSDDLFLI